MTVWVISADVDAAWVASPLYSAVIEWSPAARVVLILADPSARTCDPRVVPPSLNETVPVGAPEIEVTDAVNVMVAPGSAGFGLDDTEMDVGARITYSASAAPDEHAQSTRPSLRNMHDARPVFRSADSPVVPCQDAIQKPAPAL